MSVYTTVQGDKWDSIAYKELGSTDYTGALMGLNSKYLGYYTFPAGVKLTLPEAAGRRDTQTGVPPWRVPQG